MKDLFRRRYVSIDSEEAIESIPQGSVIYVKNKPPMVFDGRDGDAMRFYFCDDFIGKKVTQLEVSRGRVCRVGDMIAIIPGWDDKRTYLTPDDGEPYRQRRDDLVSLGMMDE